MAAQTLSHREEFLQLPPMRRYARLLGLSVVCWGGVTVLEAAQVAAGDAARGYRLGLVHYLIWPVFNWFVLALLTPLVYELGRRYPVMGANWARRIIVPHAIACVVFLLAQAVGRGLAGWVYTMNHELLASPIELAGEWMFNPRGVLALMAYWGIVLAASLTELREEMRRRELHQAQLEASLASAELEKLRMQIHPHFLFNTLQAAITLVQENPSAAEDVLLRLSELLRISFDQMEEREIPLARELEFLDLYVGIQRRRFGERLAVDIHADAAALEQRVPPLILQPLVENAIQHGIGKHKGQDHIEIFARREGDGLQVEVWNANSVVEGAGETLFQRGVGLRNTRARMEHVYGPGASLMVRGLARGGAVAVLNMPRPAAGTTA